MFKKIKLPYSSLEPYIDNETLYIHYNKHYGKYVDNLNKLLKNREYQLEDVIKNINTFEYNKRGEILFNVGGVLNHQLYFENMTPNSTISGKFKRALEQSFESFDQFIIEFKKTANTLKGSGYTFLVLNNNKLDIINLSNQENPYMYNMVPLLVLDLWEHAYYLQYKSDRSKYIDNFFKIINYDRVEARYEKEKNRKKNEK